jgi:hypothetical protein
MSTDPIRSTGSPLVSRGGDGIGFGGFSTTLTRAMVNAGILRPISQFMTPLNYVPYERARKVFLNPPHFDESNMTRVKAAEFSMVPALFKGGKAWGRWVWHEPDVIASGYAALDITSNGIREKINEVIGTKKWTLRCRTNENPESEGHYTLTAPDVGYVASFRFAYFPGCCGILVSTGADVWYTLQKKGLGKALNRLRVNMAREKGYGMLICTDRLDNLPQRKILASGGWTDVAMFNNPKTNNDIAISCYTLCAKEAAEDFPEII